MPVVKMPDGALVDLPDNPTPEQVAQLQALTESPGKAVAKETGRVLDQSLRGGAAALPGFMGDTGLAVMRNLGKPEMGAMNGTPQGMILNGLAAIFGNPAEGTKWGDVTKTIQTLGGSLPGVSKPQTSAGKAAGNIGESVVSTVLGGGAGTVGGKAAIGAGAGAGGELAARLTDDNPLARVLGSVVGGGGVAGFQAVKPNSSKLVKESTGQLTDADWAKAAQKEEVLNASNIPHTKSQLLGPRSTLDDIVQQASANPAVRPGLITKTQGAPAAAEHAVSVWTKQNLPPSVNNRSEALTDVQQSAADALEKIRSKSNDSFAKAMPPKGIEYDQGRVRTLYNGLNKLADEPRFGATTDAGKAIRKFAERLVANRETDTSNVNPTVLLRAEQEAKAAGKELDFSTLPGVKDSLTFVTNAHKINNLNKEAKLMAASEDFKGLPISDIRRIMNQATPEFNPARDAKRVVMEKEFNPTSQGLVGQLAKQGGGPQVDKLTARDTALSMVFNPTQPQAQQIKDMAKTMGPDQVGELLREHISKTMQGVLTKDDKNPRRFVQALYESPAQKENIEAALEVVARSNKQNPEAVKVGFRRLMESLDSFKDLKISSGVSPEATAQAAGGNVLSKVIRPSTTLGRARDQFVTTKTYKEIADMITSPDGLQKLQAIAKAKDPELIRQLLIGVGTSTQQGEQRSN